MSWDILSRVRCTHRVNGTSYSLTECPRCRGQEYYHDISPNAVGRLPIVTGSEKLTQSLIKGFSEGLRPSGWGFNYEIFVGTYDAETIRILLRNEVIRVISNLKQQQLSQVRSGVRLNDNEIIDRAGDLAIDTDSSEPRRWVVSAKIVTLARKEVSIVIPFQLNTVPI